MYVQGYGKVASYAEGKLFLVEELLLVIKLVLGGPGIVLVTTARAARRWLDAGGGVAIVAGTFIWVWLQSRSCHIPF